MVLSSFTDSGFRQITTPLVESGGFSRHSRFSIYQRGLGTFIQEEAKTFFDPDRALPNSVVTAVSYSGKSVAVTLADGTKPEASYALVSFNLDVLQHDDVVWEPVLPRWKAEAIQNISMVRYVCTFACYAVYVPHKFV